MTLEAALRSGIALHIARTAGPVDGIAFFPLTTPWQHSILDILVFLVTRPRRMHGSAVQEGVAVFFPERGRKSLSLLIR